MKIEKLLSGKKAYLLLVLLLLLVFPLFTSSRYVIHVGVMIFMFAAMGVAWNIIGGYGAQISWCHATFFSIGAYTSFILLLNKNISPLISIFIGMALAAVAAFVIGYPSFKLKGAFFSLATIAFGEIVRLLLLFFKDFTGGANGLMIPFKGEKPLNLQFYSEVPYYYIMLACAIIVLFITYKLERSKIGYFLKAIKEDEDAAESLGIKAYKIKLTTFVLSGALMSAIGTISAFNIAYIDPNSVGSLDLSIKIGVIAIIGGIGTLWGPILGAFALIPLTEITNTFLGNVRGGVSTAIYGLVLVLFVIFQPNGIIAFFKGRTNRNEKTSLKKR